MSYLRHRLYTNLIIDNRISQIEKTLKVYKALPFDLNYKEEVNVGNKVLQLKQKMSISEVDDYFDIFKLDISFSWQEGKREQELSRSAYLADFQYIEQ